MKVYCLWDTFYNRLISIHATSRSASAARKKYIKEMRGEFQRPGEVILVSACEVMD